LTFNKEKLKR